MRGRKSLISLVFIFITALTVKIPAAVGNPPQQSNLQVITPENADRLAQIGHLGNGRAVSAQFTADGETLVVLGTLGIWLYDQNDPAASPRLLESTHSGVHSMAVHPIENTLAMGNRDGTISFWDIESGTEFSTIEAHQTPVRLLAYNADGTRLASAGGGVFDQEQGITVDDVAKLWDMADSREIATLTNEDGLSPKQLIFLPDNSTLVINFATFCSDAPFSRTEFFDPQTGLHTKSPNWQDMFDNQLFVVSHDGTRVTIAADYYTGLWVWDTTSQAILFEYTDDESGFYYINALFSLDATRLIAIRERFYEPNRGFGQLEIWDYANNQRVDVVEFSEPINNALFNPDGSILAVITSTGSIHYYNFNLGHLQNTGMSHHDFGGFSAKVILHPNEPIIAVMEKQRAWHEYGINIAFVDYSTGSLLTTRRANQVADIAITPDGSQLIYSDKSKNISFLNMQDLNGEPVTIEIDLQDILSVAVNPTNAHQVAIGNSNSWRLGFIEDDFSYTLISQPSDNPAYAITFSPDGQWMAYASGYNGPILYDLADSYTIESPLKDSVYNLSTESIAFSPNNATIATGGKYAYGCGRSGNVQVWSVPGLELLATLEDHTEEVTAVVFSPNGSLLASSSEDGTIQIRRSDTYEILAVLEGHLGYGVNSIAFTPDGRLLISAGDDGTIRLWGISE
ncbi:MAG: PD40 domain-containing protein [Chloroflexi bacterium]|nr:PD40 domain-containing protein [Chloroflexota bacterium]